MCSISICLVCSTIHSERLSYNTVNGSSKMLCYSILSRTRDTAWLKSHSHFAVIRACPQQHKPNSLETMTAFTLTPVRDALRVNGPLVCVRNEHSAWIELLSRVAWPKRTTALTKASSPRQSYASVQDFFFCPVRGALTTECCRGCANLILICSAFVISYHNCIISFQNTGVTFKTRRHSLQHTPPHATLKSAQCRYRRAAGTSV